MIYCVRRGQDPPWGHPCCLCRVSRVHREIERVVCALCWPFVSLLNDYTRVPPGGAHSSHHWYMHSQETGQRTLQSESWRARSMSAAVPRRTNHGRRATARPATSKLALQAEKDGDKGGSSLRAWAGSARLGRQWLQQPRQAVRRERLRKCAGSGARGKQEGKSAAGCPPPRPSRSWRAV